MAIKFEKAFTLFGRCHKGCYNSSAYMSDKKKLRTLARMRNVYTSFLPLFHLTKCDIKDFMEFYRKQFPRATILPKLHIMEEHVVPWVKRWRVGAGLMGEQGEESIHAHCKRLERIHQGIPNDVDRLKFIMKEHQLESEPSLNSLRPPPKKRKKTDSDSSSSDESE